MTVFRLDDAGRPRVIASRDPFPGAVDSTELAGVARLYDFAVQGRVFNEYPSTLTGFLGGRLVRAFTFSALDSFAPIAAASVTTAPRALTKAPPSGPRTRRLFADAQLAHLAGDSTTAVERFQRVTATDSTSVLGRAAVRLATRLRGGV